jgi:hypothetical protein
MTLAYRGDAVARLTTRLIAEQAPPIYPKLVFRATTWEAQTVKSAIPMLLTELQRPQQTLQNQAHARRSNRP